MTFIPRTLGNTGIAVSPLGLGTVKFGRNQQVKYPKPFALPSDAEVQNLLALARELGINLLDTAPAYGLAQERLGRLLPGPRTDWVIISKVGEFFENGQSRFDFSYQSCISQVEQSLATLKTDYLDGVLIHSDGNDLDILQQGVVDALEHLKERGLIRSHGMSSKTVAGGIATVERLDMVMASFSPAYQEERPVLEAAARLNKGVLIKKALHSGHIAGPDGVREAMQLVFAEPGVSSLILGTLNPEHLKANVASARACLGRAE